MTTIIKSPPEVLPYVAEVSAAIDANKKSLGFLPKSAIDSHGAKGQLWVAVGKQQELQGFVMFGGGKSNLPVFAVHVLPDFEGRGIAKRMIGELKIHAEELGFQTLSAKVAADLSANQFWDSCGFLLFRQIPGGASTQRTINVRVYEIPDLSLLPDKVKSRFDECLSAQGGAERDDCVIDINVLLDQVKDRKESEYARRLLRLGFNGQLQLRVAPEFSGELERNSKQADDPLLKLARDIPTLHGIAQAEVDQFVEAARKEIFPNRTRVEDLTVNEKSDLIHLAYCAKYQIAVFVTRDNAILRAADWITENYGVRVMTPFDLVESIDSFGGAEEVKIQSDSGLYIVRPFNAGSDTVGVSESPSKIPEFFAEYSRDPAFRRYILECDGRIDGVAFIGTSSNFAVDVNLACAFAPKAPAGRYLLLLLGLIRDVLKQSRLARVSVDSPQDSMEVWSTLADLGFKQSTHVGLVSGIRRMSKFTYQGVILQEHWKAFARNFQSVSDVELEKNVPSFANFSNTGISWNQRVSGKSGHATLRSIEETLEPAIFALHDRPASIVPIKPAYAVHLLGVPDATDDMFGALPISLSQHRVYFRSARNSERVEPGGLIFFYVSGRVGAITAMARVISSDIRDVEFAVEFFQRRGVLNADQLAGMANKSGNVHCIRFNSVHRLPVELTLEQLKEMGVADESNMVTVRRLNSNELQRVLEKGFDT